MGSSVLNELGTTAVGRLYQKHYGRVTSARRLLVHLAQMIEVQEQEQATMVARIETLETELEKIRKMMSAKSDQATAHTNRRGKRNGNH